MHNSEHLVNSYERLYGHACFFTFYDMIFLFGSSVIPHICQLIDYTKEALMNIGLKCTLVNSHRFYTFFFWLYENNIDIQRNTTANVQIPLARYSIEWQLQICQLNKNCILVLAFSGIYL